MQHSVTPVSTATQSVSRLQTLLAGRQASPSETLLELFRHVIYINNDTVYVDMGTCLIPKIHVDCSVIFLPSRYMNNLTGKMCVEGLEWAI